MDRIIKFLEDDGFIAFEDEATFVVTIRGGNMERERLEQRTEGPQWMSNS